MPRDIGERLLDDAKHRLAGDSVELGSGELGCHLDGHGDETAAREQLLGETADAGRRQGVGAGGGIEPEGAEHVTDRGQGAGRSLLERRGPRPGMSPGGAQRGVSEPRLNWSQRP